MRKSVNEAVKSKQLDHGGNGSCLGMAKSGASAAAADEDIELRRHLLNQPTGGVAATFGVGGSGNCIAVAAIGGSGSAFRRKSRSFNRQLTCTASTDDLRRRRESFATFNASHHLSIGALTVSSTHSMRMRGSPLGQSAPSLSASMHLPLLLLCHWSNKFARDCKAPSKPRPHLDSWNSS
ncbi:hypothetical protein CHUAL_006405 [Chamberlinius hualienensis]